MMRRRQVGDEEESSSMDFYDLSALVLSLLRSPPPMRSRPPRSVSMAHITPSGFASMLLGVSVALMLCGSVTFFIGFLLLPWVLALFVVFYVAGIVSAISIAGRAILCCLLPPPRKENGSCYEVMPFISLKQSEQKKDNPD